MERGDTPERRRLFDKFAASPARFLFPLNEASDREMRISETGEDRAGRVTSDETLRTISVGLLSGRLEAVW